MGLPVVLCFAITTPFMIAKRLFDIFFSLLLALVAVPLLLPFVVVAAADTSSDGFFRQVRIGQYGKPFRIIKLRTLHRRTHRISRYGRFLRHSKIDELPQLWHVLTGTMSFVGPRPDVPGYYDTLQGQEQVILHLKPGLTSEAGLYYRREEELLAEQSDPLHYNDTVLFPDKVRMNLHYYYHRSFRGDLKLIAKTVVKVAGTR